ncbi:MAG TPA: hypothetical protein VM580_26125 [Labilithrix sp.]|nr:hypothetical protein [Labilithrix sp.]
MMLQSRRRTTIGTQGDCCDRPNLARSGWLRAGGALTLLATVGCSGAEGAVAEADDGTTLPAPGGEADAGPPAVIGQPVPGVYVSTSKGTDVADGAPSRPVKTLEVAMRLAKERNVPVIACAETYAESVTLVDGVTMYGYFDCSRGDLWPRVKASAIIASPTSPAVLAENLKTPARFEGFDVRAPNLMDVPATKEPAASSYGMIIKNTTGLSLAEVTIRGGEGQPGASGPEPANGNSETGGSVEGENSSVQKKCVSSNLAVCEIIRRVGGSAGGTSKCAHGANGGPGGNGGDAAVLDSRGVRELIGSDARGQPLSSRPETAVGAPENSAANVIGTAGKRGDPGLLGKHGTWTFGAEGFTPGDGTKGAIGSPGQGGGGGGGSSGWLTDDYLLVSLTPGAFFIDGGARLGAAGAGGGAGGCGGMPGSPGRGGGASIGLFVSSSDVQIAASRIESQRGGAAGKGALGTLGTPGGRGGLGHVTVTTVAGFMNFSRTPGVYGTAGGKGGDGGAAGLSGHGAAGPSFALVYTGKKPTMTQVDLVPGEAGAGFEAIEREGQTLPPIVGTARKEYSF